MKEKTCSASQELHILILMTFSKTLNHSLTLSQWLMMSKTTFKSGQVRDLLEETLKQCKISSMAGLCSANNCTRSSMKTIQRHLKSVMSWNLMWLSSQRICLSSNASHLKQSWMKIGKKSKKLSRFNNSREKISRSACSSQTTCMIILRLLKTLLTELPRNSHLPKTWRRWKKIWDNFKSNKLLTKVLV